MTTLGKYVLVRELGAGGHAKVMLALDPETNQYYALKVCKKDYNRFKNMEMLYQEKIIMEMQNH